MTKDFVLEVQVGVRNVFDLKDDNWLKRQIVAQFVPGDEGDFAFACFKEGLARRGGSLRDGQGFYHVGTIAQLSGNPLLDARFVADPGAR